MPILSTRQIATSVKVKLTDLLFQKQPFANVQFGMRERTEDALLMFFS